MGSRSSMRQSLKPKWMVLTGIGLGLTASVVTGASAQQTLYVGASGGQSVVVDLQAIEGTPVDSAPAMQGDGMPNLSRYHYSGRTLKWPEPDMLLNNTPAPTRKAAAQPQPEEIDPVVAEEPMETESMPLAAQVPVQPEPQMPKEVPAAAPVAPVEVTETPAPEAAPETTVAAKPEDSGMPAAATAPSAAETPAAASIATAQPTALKPQKTPEPIAEAPAAPAPVTEEVTPAVNATVTATAAPEQPEQTEAASTSEQVAALSPEQPAVEKSPTSMVATEGVTFILFGSEGETVPDNQKATLTRIAASYANTEQRIQLKAYAGTENTNNSLARRLSLKRALAVRSFLMDSGIRGKRIDVRALGIANDGGPADRVEISTLTQ